MTKNKHMFNSSMQLKQILLIQNTKRTNIVFGQNHAKTATVTGRVLLF